MLETAFTMDTSSIKYGPGVTREVGHDMRQMGGRRVMVVTDPGLSASEPVAVTLAALRDAGVDATLFDQARVEPTDASLKDAVRFALDGCFDGYVAVGGGSSIDTAKAADLCASHPAEFLAYVNPPIGEGRPVPGKMAPLIAIPTTAGTGSETTGVVVFDLVELRAKTAIRQRAARPALGIIDPLNTRTLSPMVTACSGLDVLCHSLESLTGVAVRPPAGAGEPGAAAGVPGRQSHQRRLGLAGHRDGGGQPGPRVRRPCRRAGSRRHAAGRLLRRGGLRQRRHASRARDVLSGVRHGARLPAEGLSADASPGPARHVRGSQRPSRVPLHGTGRSGAPPLGGRADGPGYERGHRGRGRRLAGGGANCVHAEGGMPNGLAAVGYGPQDVDQLVAGTLPQHTVTKLSPRPASAEDLRQLFLESMTLW